jgi:HEAT repeat protein
MTKSTFFAALACCWGCCAALGARELAPLIDNLNADDFELRQNARLELRQTLVDATPEELRPLERELLEFIGPTHDWATRDWTIRMLELVGTRAAVKPLEELLDDPDPRIRDLARRALAANPANRAAARLIHKARQAPATERAAYADALAYHGDERAVPLLASWLSPDTPGAPEAAMALGKIGGLAALNALAKAHAGAEGALKRDLEFALLDADPTSRRLTRRLAESGQTEVIRTAALHHLRTLDPKAATEVLAAALANHEAPERPALLRMAMDSPLHEDLAGQLPTLSEADQRVVLGAIADARRSEHEGAVLALLDTVSPELRAVVVTTLGHIGSDASFQPLLDLHLADERDREAAAALARLNAPSTDDILMATAQSGDGSIQERVAALRLLVMRNTPGVTALLNQLGEDANDPEIRVAAFRGMEVVGDPASVDRLLEVVLADDSLKQQAQGSLKRLSSNLGVPDYLWTQHYGPAMATTSDERRQDLLAILDGISGPTTAAYLRELALAEGPLRAPAINALRRWTDISGMEIWLALAAAPDATPEDVAEAQRGMLRLLGSTRVTGSHPEQVRRAVDALRAFPDDVEFRKAVLRTYDRRLHWQTRMHLTELIPEFLADAAIEAEVRELLERSRR